MNLPFITRRDASTLLSLFLQHIEELVQKSPVYRVNRKDYTVSEETCREKKTEERQRANLCILLSRSSCLFVESPKEKEKKKRGDVFTICKKTKSELRRQIQNIYLKPDLGEVNERISGDEIHLYGSHDGTLW